MYVQLSDKLKPTNPRENETCNQVRIRVWSSPSTFGLSQQKQKMTIYTRSSTYLHASPSREFIVLINRYIKETLHRYINVIKNNHHQSR